MSVPHQCLWSSILEVGEMNVEMVVGRLVMEVDSKLITFNTKLPTGNILKKEG